jgi:hypothetical protein
MRKIEESARRSIAIDSGDRMATGSGIRKGGDEHERCSLIYPQRLPLIMIGETVHLDHNHVVAIATHLAQIGQQPSPCSVSCVFFSNLFSCSKVGWI